MLLGKKKGKLSIEDPMQYIPGLIAGLAGRISRYENLLTHTSGNHGSILPDLPHLSSPGRVFDRKQRNFRAQYIRHACFGAVLNLPPGETLGVQQSQILILLGFIVHKLAGKPTGVFYVKEKIFQAGKN
jgi:CubicO group peptidase (beta-lactamase class C family)